MDLQLKQWRSQQQNESEEEQASVTKMSNFYFDQIQSQTPTCAALPLFEPTSSSSSRLSSFSCFSPPDSSSYSPSFRLPKMGSLFTWAQWQELELQALIFRYMLVGAAVPQELLLPIKKSLMLRSPSHFLQHPIQHPLQHFPHQQPPWYWGRGAMDPEPGRCKRTDGKKWRCSRDVVAGHKYCERHIHRGRNRSRKPVEIPSPSPNPNPNSTITATATSRAIVDQLDTACGGHGATLHSSSDQLLHLNQSYSEMKQESNNNNNNNKRSYEFSNGGSDDGHTLRHFFDDWPRSSDSTSSSINSATCLSISMPENVSSDVSLKLFTGNEEEELRNGDNSHGREEQNMMSWWSNGGNQQQQEMGGPLAEALRSASSSSSPTSVLRRLGISTQVFN